MIDATQEIGREMFRPASPPANSIDEQPEGVLGVSSLVETVRRKRSQPFETPVRPDEVLSNPVQRQEAASLQSTPPDMDRQPLPLIRSMQPSQPFPIEALPTVMRNAAAKVREVVQAPLGMICSSFLGAATVVVQPHVDVQIDGLCFPTCNNFVTVGESGERKTATDRITTGPIKERQIRETEAYHEGTLVHDAAHSAWIKGREAALKNGSGVELEAMLLDLGEEPTHIQPFYLCEEPSFEGIERTYAEGRYTLGLFSDEGGRFLGGYAMSRDNQVKTVTGLSKLWDGDPLDRVRAGDGLSVLYGRRLSMHLMIQPVLAGALFANNMLSGQGFLSRCLCCYPASTIGHRRYCEYDLAADRSIEAYYSRMNDIMDIPLPLEGSAKMGLRPRKLKLEPRAKAQWIAFADHIETLQKEGGELHSIRGLASKGAEHAARIAAVLTIFASPDAREITVEAIEAGIAVISFYLGEALCLYYTSTDDQELVLAQKVFDWGMQQGGLLSLVDLYQYGPNAVRDKRTATRMIEILEQHYRAERINGSSQVNGKMRRDVWRLRGDQTA